MGHPVVQINLGNVVELAHIAKRLSVFSYFNTTEYEYLLSKCCRFLQRKLCTHVIDFSGLKLSSCQFGTVEMLYDRVLELPLFVCHQCSEFISERHHDCPLRNNTNTSLAAKGALAHHLQRRTAFKIQCGRQGAPKWPTGS